MLNYFVFGKHKNLRGKIFVRFKGTDTVAMKL